VEGHTTRFKATSPKAIKVPSQAECFALLKRYDNYPHIIAHSQKVAKVALFLANSLKESGFVLNLSLIKAGALLHDIAKTYSLKHPGVDHAKKGAEWIEAAGYPEVAEIIRWHVELPHKAEIDEKTIVNYADKRVKHENIVSLEERFEDLLKRYGKNKSSRKRIEDFYIRTKTFEKKLFSYLPFGPEFLKILEVKDETAKGGSALWR